MSIEIIFEEESDMSDPSADTVFDLADCCRTCLGHECSLTPTNSSDRDSIKFCDKLAACVSGIKWAREGVPSFICGICIEKLRIAYDFQVVCLQSDRTLQLQGETNEIQGSRSAKLDPLIPTSLAGCDEAIGKVISSIKCEETETQILPTVCLQSEQAFKLRGKADEIQGFRSASPDPTTPTGLAGCDEAIAKVVLNTKFEETETKILPQCTPITSAAAPLEATQAQDNPYEHGCQVYEKESCERSRTHVGEKRLQCPVCLKQFAITAELTAHTEIHAEEKRFVCNFCKKESMNESDFLAHICPHRSEGPFMCSYCDKKFTNRHMLNSHLRTHAGNRKWRCRICNKSYTKSSNLTRHMKTHTRDKLSCTLCSKTFAQSSSLNAHMKRYACDNLADMKRHTDDKCCEHCNKSYKKNCNLSDHMRTYSGKKYSCKLCDKKIACLTSLITHMKIHTSNKPWRCQNCNKSYRFPSQLSTHMKTHTGEKFSCKLCDKQYTQSHSLNVHMKRHTGEKLSWCKICNKSYPYRSLLAEHMKIHTGEKFPCKLCDKKFAWSSSLTTHMKTHTRENLRRCKICNKSYTKPAYLSVHMRTHTGEKYFCKLCDKQYAQSYSLNVHMKSHSSEKP